jgi:apolipoprotein N-acyltransferase
VKAPEGAGRVRLSLDRAALSEALPVALLLLALFFAPWGPGTESALCFAWDLAQTEFARAIPAIVGPVAGIVLLAATVLPVAARGRDAIWAALGFLLLAAGMSEAADAFAAQGTGPALFLAAALGALGHRLRQAGTVPGLARAALGLAAVLALAHFLWPVASGEGTALRLVRLIETAFGSPGPAPGFLRFEALVGLYLLGALASACRALPRTPSRADRWLGHLHLWMLPSALVVASIPVLAEQGVARASGYLTLAVALASSVWLAVRGAEGALARAERLEYAHPEPHPFFTRLCLTAIAGALVFFSFPRYDQIHLVWFAFLPVLFVISDVTPRQAFRWGWWMGIVTNFGGFYWVTGLLVNFALLPTPVALLLSLLLAAYNGLVFALWAWLTRKLDGQTRIPSALFSALSFTAAEFLLWELFPWYLGNSQYLFPQAIQIADLTGVPGVTFLVAFVGLTLSVVVRAALRGEAFPRGQAAAALACLTATLVYGEVRIAQVESASREAPRLKVGVVQADLRIKEAGYSAYRKLQNQERMARELVAQGAEIIVLPESAIPVLYPKSVKVLSGVADRIGAPVLFGAGSEDAQGRQFNTAFFVDPDGTVLGMYDKNYPLLFGEYLPFVDHPWLSWVKDLLPYASFLTPGTEVEVFSFRGHRLGIMICYEDILPAFTRRLAGKDPNLLLNLTNDAWFGRTSEPHHHMALSIFRAIENRLYLVRSVRTGVSGFVDATGRIYAQTQIEEPAALLREVAMLQGTTVYREVGDVFAYLVLGALAFAIAEALWRRRRERKTAASG